MNLIKQKQPEDWSEFQKRVFSAESHYGLGFAPRIKAASVIAIIAGLVVILFCKFGIWIPVLYNLGSFSVGIGAILLAVIYWVNSGTNVVVKERLKSIQDRGMTKRCFYLSGDLPDGLSPRSGKCELYNKNLVSYPYCVYCKSYITKKQMEEENLNVQID